MRFKTPILISLIVLALLAVGAGAAAGVVLEGDVDGAVPITVNQAVLVQKPQAVNFPAGRKFFSSTSDNQTKFSVALELFRGDTVTVVIPLVNRSSQDTVGEFSVTLPDIPTLVEGEPGVTLDVSGSGTIDDVVKISSSSWTFTADAGTNGLDADPDDGLVLTFKIAPTAMAGFFEATGRIRVVEF